MPSAREDDALCPYLIALGKQNLSDPNQWDYLEVLFSALSTFGAPKAIVGDGGAIFYCNQAMDVYATLGIEKLRIEKRQAWQNYVESKSRSEGTHSASHLVSYVLEMHTKSEESFAAE